VICSVVGPGGFGSCPTGVLVAGVIGSLLTIPRPPKSGE
jgi:hypothetical protein